jgi:thiosulfate reductase cytochrome b subunit
VLNGFVYLGYGLASGHVRRDLLPSFSGLRRIGRSLVDHIRLRFPRGDEARRYNVLQQLTAVAARLWFSELRIRLHPLSRTGADGP